jgi:uncharacterized delta-60 repeat protein
MGRSFPPIYRTAFVLGTFLAFILIAADVAVLSGPQDPVNAQQSADLQSGDQGPQPIAPPVPDAGDQNLLTTSSLVFNPGADGIVWSIAVQADEKIIIAGEFTSVGGLPRNRIARLYPDGTVDPNFNPGANGTIYRVLVEPAGTILIAGNFTRLGGGGTGNSVVNRIARLNKDGSIASGELFIDLGPNNTIRALALQADGRMIVGGLFTVVRGGLPSPPFSTPLTRNFLARLDQGLVADDSIPPFVFNPGANNSVYDLATQPDGKIIAVGTFTTLGGGGTGTTVRNRIGRLSSDGALDTTFNPGANGNVFSVVRQTDGKIVVGGGFTGLGAGTGATLRNRIGRLNSDGSVDTTFNPGANAEVLCLAQQADGKLLVGGNFTLIGGGTGTTIRNFIARLNSDGSVDATFNSGANGGIAAVRQRSDGKVLIGGNFTSLGAGAGILSRNFIGLMNSDGTVDTTPSPKNNNFVDAQVISGNSGLVYGVNVGGNKETGEPNHAGNRGGASVWYRWQATFSGPAIFTTFESDFDTLLAVYTGSSVNALTPVANGSNDDNTNADNTEGHTLTSSVTFNAVLGTTYYIAVDGSGGRAGAIALRWGAEVSIGGQVMVSGFKAKLTLSGDDSRAVIFTNGVGNYTFQHLRAGGRYVITPLAYNFSTIPCVLTVPLSFEPLLNTVTNANFIDTGCRGSGGGSVSGLVRRSNGPGIPGVAISITGTVNKNTVTGPDGLYDVSDLPVSGNYTVTPSSPFFNFTPLSRPFAGSSDMIGADFVAGDSFEISGQARAIDATPIAGVTLTLNTSPLRTVQTDAAGYYSIIVPGGGSYALTASKSGVSFTQPTINFTNVSANQKNADYLQAVPVVISGTVKNVNQRGLSGIRVDLSGDTNLTTQTGSNGSYSFSVPPGGSYTVAPNDIRVSAWTPQNSRQFNNLTQSASGADFQALFPTFTVSGFVTNSGGTALSGVKVRLTGTNLSNKEYTTFPDGSYQSDPLNVLGDYTFTPLPPFTSGGVTYGSFDPTDKSFQSMLTCNPSSFSCSGFDYKGIDFRAVPSTGGTVQFTSANFNGAENAGTINVTVSRVGGSSGPATVQFSGAPGGTATGGASCSSGVDYITPSGTLSWGDGQSNNQSIVLTICNDNVFEGIETLNLQLTNATGATLGTQTTATFTINEDDSQPGISISDPIQVEGNSGTSDFTFTVSLTNATTQTVTVNYATANGTATTADNDYVAVPSTLLTFTPLQTSRNITVTVNGDTKIEPNETFVVNLSNPTGASLVKGVGTATIQNDDSPGTIQFSQATYTAAENGGTANVIVTRTGNVSGAATVQFGSGAGSTATGGASCTSGVDYITPAGLSWPDGDGTSKTFVITLCNDNIFEGNELVNMSLTNMTGASPGTQSTATLTINDDDTQPAISIDDLSLAEGNRGVTNFTFTVSLSNPTSQTVSVNYATANGTATTADSDYGQVSPTTLTFAPGQGSRTLTIGVIGDMKTEPDETFFVDLSSPVGATISRARGTGTIRNDDANTIQFAAASLNVSEAVESAQVVVNRADSSSAATVNYATTDNAGLNECTVFNGVASSRCDYTISIGVLRFAVGESSKTIFVPIINDVYAEGNETFTISLSNSSGPAIVAPSTMTITIQDNETSTGVNPIDGIDFFIRQQYLDFLGREPGNGLADWRNVLVNCGITVTPPCDRIEVSAGFFRSEEFQSRGYFIYRFYSAVGKIPLSGEFFPDAAKLSGFLSAEQLEANKVAYVNEFMARADFQNKYSTTFNNPTGYVDALLQTVGLPNHPSRGGWIATLNNSNTAQNRALVLRQLVESSEVYNKYYNEAFVIMQYFGYLRRTADASYLSWIQTMNQTNGDYRIMINGFMNSAEYRRRFGP